MARTRRHNRAGRRRRQSTAPATDGSSEQRQKLIDALLRHLRQDPTFQITTVDGLHWIDPHSGALVEATFDREQVALEWLLHNRPWRTYPPKHIQQLRFLRWRHYLAGHVEHDPHLRIFAADGAWLNPYTGEWEEDICLGADSRISSHMLDSMAKRLIQSGEDVLAECLSMAELQHLLQTRRRNEPGGSQHHESEPNLSLSATHPTIDAWPDDVIEGDSGSQDGQPSYALDDELDSPDLDFLKHFRPGATAPARAAPAAPPATPPVAKPAGDSRSGGHPPVEDDDRATEQPMPGSATVRRVNPDKARSNRSFGDYRLLNKLAEGGLGGIYKAEHVDSGEPAVLNVLLAEVSADERFATDFLSQGCRTMELQHPELVRCLDIGKDQGRLYMALEYMPDGDAATLARSRPHCRLAWQEVLPWSYAVCRALDELRRSGYMHGNIRPSTIYPVEGGGAKLGHPQLPCCHEHRANRNREYQAFWSPEEARHEQLDIRTDIYAIGLSLFTLIAGEVPYHDLDPERMQQRIAIDPPPDLSAQIAEAPPGLSRVIKTCLAKNAEARFQEPSELLIALQRVGG